MEAESLHSHLSAHVCVCVRRLQRQQCCNPSAPQREDRRAFCKGQVHIVLTHTSLSE